MKLKEVRIYCECYEQGLYLLKYIINNKKLTNLDHKIIYTTKGNFKLYYKDSVIAQLLHNKKFDGIISVVDKNDIEHPITTIEFSTAVPTDDHILQRYDFVYWSAFYQVPCIKISSSEKNNTKFGGGNKIKIEHEYYAALNIKGVYYHIEWPLIKNSDLVKTDFKMISSPPYLDELQKVINQMIDSFYSSKNDKDYFALEQEKFKKYINKNFSNNKLNFTNSTRLNFDNKGKITIKFNRYGHGMDPERGMLIFFNNVYAKRPIIKFIVQRENREMYKKMYDSKDLKYIMDIIDKKVIGNKNNMTFDIAFDLFKKATSTNDLFEHAKIVNNVITINDADLIRNLEKRRSVVNSLLHFGEKIILADLNDDIIVEIKWNISIVDKFYLLKKKESLSVPKKKLPIKIISNNRINEDVITYTSNILLIKNNMKNIGVSYPGAQGDRKILKGSGVNTKRDYVDVISIKENENGKYDILLQENKQRVSETEKSDIDKLLTIINTEDKKKKLDELIKTVYRNVDINKCYIGVGGSKPSLSKNNKDIDYIIFVEIDNDHIKWEIETTNKNVINMFNNLLSGEIVLDYPMYIVED